MLETVAVLKTAGIMVKHCVMILDRQQGGRENLSSNGVCAHSLMTMSDLLEALAGADRLSAATCEAVRRFIAENQAVLSLPPPAQPPASLALTFKERARACSHNVTVQLMLLIERKQSNLCFSADFTNSGDLLAMTDLIGPEICMLKTHFDMVKDFTAETASALQHLAEKHNFLLFEDRKYSDIGQTVKLQYGPATRNDTNAAAGDRTSPSQWAHITDAHIVSGPGKSRVRGDVLYKLGVLTYSHRCCRWFGSRWKEDASWFASSSANEFKRVYGSGRVHRSSSVHRKGPPGLRHWFHLPRKAVRSAFLHSLYTRCSAKRGA